MRAPLLMLKKFRCVNLHSDLILVNLSLRADTFLCMVCFVRMAIPDSDFRYMGAAVCWPSLDWGCGK